jgi:signal transduction histidine kinase
VLVQLRRDDAGWCLVVHDDGIGFDLPAAQVATSRHHFGLAIMRERVESLGGTLQIETTPGAGTTVSACIPNLPPSAPSAPSSSKEVERGAPAALAG